MQYWVDKAFEDASKGNSPEINLRIAKDLAVEGGIRLNVDMKKLEQTLLEGERRYGRLAIWVGNSKSYPSGVGAAGLMSVASDMMAEADEMAKAKRDKVYLRDTDGRILEDFREKD